MSAYSRSEQVSLICLLVACLNLVVSSATGQQIPFGATNAQRPYGPEQVAGEPNVPQAGDNGSAWASKTADDADEWLLCEFQKAVMLKSVSVYETYNPGALYKVTVFPEDGAEETVAWEGEDPTPQDQPKGISVIPVKVEFPVRRIKLYLDSPRVSGWNEIDAVGIEDTDGNRFWAKRVEASTTYASPDTPMPFAGKRPYVPDQAAGEPDSPGGGDQPTAWASTTADGQKEWLICEFETAQKPREIVVHETYNPGAVYKVTLFDQDGEEAIAWEGEDPTPRDQPRGISVFPIEPDFAFSKIKIYIDSPAVPGWNEIDAVGLRAAGEETQWASKVKASSTFGVSNTMRQETSMTSSVAQQVKQFFRDSSSVLQEMQDELELKALRLRVQQQADELTELREEVKKLKEQVNNSAKQ